MKHKDFELFPTPRVKRTKTKVAKSRVKPPFKATPEINMKLARVFVEIEDQLRAAGHSDPNILWRAQGLAVERGILIKDVETRIEIKSNADFNAVLPWIQEARVELKKAIEVRPSLKHIPTDDLIAELRTRLKA